MTKLNISNVALRKGFARGFSSITSVYGKNPHCEVIIVSPDSVGKAWRDVGRAIEDSMNKVKSQDDKGSSKKKRSESAQATTSATG